MNEPISPYIQGIRDWKVRDIIESYLKSLQIFKFFNYEFRNGRMLSYKDLRKISEHLWDAKEGNYLIFKRITNPKKHKFEKAPKFIPNEDEIAFMNNVGLLFHRVMVARELKYILEFYENDSELFQESKHELTIVLRRILKLFEQGIELLKKVLKYQTNNIPLLTYFLENKSEVEMVLGSDLSQILEPILGEQKIEQAYFRVGSFYYDSGWIEQANSMMEKVLQVNPSHPGALELLQCCSVSIPQN
ncbi:hypothetical protein JW964_27815 [candidate division KSB1 bacterium]|nr:hypothetical protein [candidate division KSB1 bacterium]